MVIILYWITSFGIWTPLKLVAMWLILIKQLCASYCSTVLVSPAALSGWCWLRRKCHRSGERWGVERRRCHTILPQAPTYREKHKCNIGKQMNSIVVCFWIEMTSGPPKWATEQNIALQKVHLWSNADLRVVFSVLSCSIFVMLICFIKSVSKQAEHSMSYMS